MQTPKHFKNLNVASTTIYLHLPACPFRGSIQCKKIKATNLYQQAYNVDNLIDFNPILPRYGIMLPAGFKHTLLIPHKHLVQYVSLVLIIYK